MTSSFDLQATYVKTVNNRYGTIDLKKLAQKVFKTTVDAGSAVVNILGATGIAGFKFNIPQEELIKLENEITDQYTESNFARQDHIALKPVTITVNGLVGDYFYSINQIEDALALIVPTITLVKEFIPQIRSVTQRQKINHLQKAESNIQKQDNGSYKAIVRGKEYEYSFNSMDLFSLFQSLYKLKSPQTRAFLFFEALRKSRATFSVETTWKRYNNMAVQTIQAKRDNNADITNFTATFKQLDFTQSRTETMQEYKNRMEQQKAETVNKGVVKGEEISMVSDIQYV